MFPFCFSLRNILELVPYRERDMRSPLISVLFSPYLRLSVTRPEFNRDSVRYQQNINVEVYVV